MPFSPYPISGQLKDIDNSTLLGSSNSATVRFFNTATGETLSVTSSGAGDYTVDLANYPSGYSNSQKILVTAYNSYCSVSCIHKVNTTIGAATINLTLTPNPDMFNRSAKGAKTLKAYSIANKHATTDYRYDLFDALLGKFRMSIYCPAKLTTSSHFEDEGVRFDGGIIAVVVAKDADFTGTSPQQVNDLIPMISLS